MHTHTHQRGRLALPSGETFDLQDADQLNLGAAAVWARVAGVVYGTSIATLIRFGWGQIDLPLLDVVPRSTFWTMPIVGGYLTAETDPLYAGGPPSA